MQFVPKIYSLNLNISICIYFVVVVVNCPHKCVLTFKIFFIFHFLIIYLLERESAHARERARTRARTRACKWGRGGGRRRESPADSLLSAEPHIGAHCTTLRSQQEPNQESAALKTQPPRHPHKWLFK